MFASHARVIPAFKKIEVIVTLLHAHRSGTVQAAFGRACDNTWAVRILLAARVVHIPLLAVGAVAVTPCPGELGWVGGCHWLSNTPGKLLWINLHAACLLPRW
jgi:hypothetical protein